MTDTSLEGVLFNCCNAYSRVYRNQLGDYVGSCPKCTRQLLLAGGAIKPAENDQRREVVGPYSDRRRG